MVYNMGGNNVWIKWIFDLLDSVGFSFIKGAE
jgi:hypothetical protein